MKYIKVTNDFFNDLAILQKAYKKDIGENEPTKFDLDTLFKAVLDEQILFFGCIDNGKLIACCSISPTFSTFDYKRGGLFEDFYIL